MKFLDLGLTLTIPSRKRQRKLVTWEVFMKRTVVLGLTLALGALPVFAGDCGSKAAYASNVESADIVETAAQAGTFSTLLAAAKAAGLVDTLKADGPYTVFAPSDEAFAKLPEGTVEGLLANPDKLRQVLLYHVVPGRVMAADVVNLSSATTAQGSDVNIRLADGSVMINEAKVTATDIEASNGVIHVIDSVILPRG
jgi:uncharacterized surface protein with fasciclin (FAS1) repeats